jgi:hypothetical protein
MCCLRLKESLQRENISTEGLRSHGGIEMSLVSILPTFPEFLFTERRYLGRNCHEQAFTLKTPRACSSISQLAQPTVQASPNPNVSQAPSWCNAQTANRAPMQLSHSVNDLLKKCAIVFRSITALENGQTPSLTASSALTLSLTSVISRTRAGSR